MQPFSRRSLLGGATATAAALASASAASVVRAADSSTGQTTFRIGLNTSTLRGQKLPLAEVVELAGKAGYQSLEPWIDELEAHTRGGGSLKEIGRASCRERV